MGFTFINLLFDLCRGIEYVLRNLVTVLGSMAFYVIPEGMNNLRITLSWKNGIEREEPVFELKKSFPKGKAMVTEWKSSESPLTGNLLIKPPSVK